MRNKKSLMIMGLVLLVTLFVAQTALGQDEEITGPRSKAAPGLGTDPSELVLKGGVVPVELMQEKDENLSDSAGNENHFNFSGFLRVPMRMGIGNSKDLNGTGSENKRLHLPPLIPDEGYLDWRCTNNMGGPWTELKLTYGNKHVAANISIASYSITDGSWKNPMTQLGIDQSFISFSYPSLFKNGGLVANVGVFANRYGSAGRYSAEKYDTYLFGATHVAGENIRLFFDLSPRFTLHFEQGFGGKLEVVPFVDNALSESLSEYPYFPYPGPEEQGDTLLHHEHVGFSVDDKLFVGAHFMMSFTADAEGEEEDARLINTGLDLKLVDFLFGDAYLGYSHIDVKNALRLAGAIETLHSVDGWSLVDNYFHVPDAYTPEGTGTIDTIMAQYTFSLAKALWHPTEFWGQARDLKLSVFGMYNIINTDDENFDGAKSKLKVGGDITYTPVKWFGLSSRYDLVQPNMADNTLSFHEITGALIFRSNFISNEQVVLSYSHYIYGENVAPGWPNHLHTPDTDVITISAIMWW